ncbi:CTP synthase-like protein [Massarina eburnea CBS 473.64]|uniref:CTP synthase n=1 Tax=Massarina eburnea CBS 473.64 TaxID=1395130 RepID=A0A6A6RGM5_9PLEO|nr:CTP synthase-like protein [Massarina eburnea CBS 473.64]
MKYVLVSGGVISGVGKHVSSIKIDPYLNVDAGTMNPKEHGEVFVLSDGGEVDLDLGNYERYLNITLTRDNNITTGKIYDQVIKRERRGDYLGKTVQVVPHITDAIQDWIERVARVPVDDSGEEPDVCIIELGGTVGDLESGPFVEALTQLKLRAGKDDFLQVHVSYVPVINGEQKTKPTQQAIKEVRRAGFFPDLIACRCEIDLEPAAINKIARFCQVNLEQVIVVKNMPSTYQVPMLLEQQGLIPLLRKILALDNFTISDALEKKGRATWAQWNRLTAVNLVPDLVTIALVGKYIELHDSYLSVVKSLEHSAMRCGRKLAIRWVDAEHLEEKTRLVDPAKFHTAWTEVCTAHGVLVPGGFGQRGTEGMIQAVKWARENKKPYLGVCLGMQVAVIEYARHVCGISDATSGEFNGTAANKLIIHMAEIDKETMGATMRLGLHPTLFQSGSEWSRLRALYAGKDEIHERHRHRYEVNPDFVEKLEQGGLSFTGKDDLGVRMEVIEIKDHPWFVGVQFHPEYLSRVLDPSRPYLGFIAACSGQLDNITAEYKNGSAANGNGHIVNGNSGLF